MKPEAPTKDGGYYLNSYLKQANQRLGKLGKRGKRAKLKKSGNNLAVQFSFDGEQQQKGINLRLTKKNLVEGEKIAAMITNQLVVNQFTWQWFNSLIGKNSKSVLDSNLDCIQLITDYKTHFFKENKSLKSLENSWSNSSSKIEQILATKKESLSNKIIREIIDSTENNTVTRRLTLNGLLNFLAYVGTSEYDPLIDRYKKNNKPKQKIKNIPSDIQIMSIYNEGFKIPTTGTPKYRYRCQQWQFLYSLLAVYGLRVHEAWNIANWDTEVVFDKGDWIVFDDNENEISVQNQGELQIIPAILNPKNDKHILCIKHDTKTGYRMVIPISPSDRNWIQEFDLLQPMNLPDLKNPLRRTGKKKASYQCTNDTGRWFRTRKYGFSPHCLRYAYNHRAHNLGFNPKDIANSLGHTLTTNQTIYLRNESFYEKYKTLVLAVEKEQLRKNTTEQIEFENKRLREENERLKTLLKMHQAITEN